MKKNSKIYVAGHRGLVGSAIVRKLLDDGHTNLITKTKEELNLKDPYAVKSFFELERPEFVFLAAAKVGGIGYNSTHPAEFIYDNLMIQTNTIDAAYRSGVKKLLFLGSACIYPKLCENPIKEESLLTSSLEPTNEAYSLAKISGLKMCEYYNKQYGFNAISAMPANIYGINDNFHPENGHVIPSMISKFLNAKDSNSDVTFWGDGTPIREFLYVDDLADACVFLMHHYNGSQHINVGSDTEIQIKELCELIKNGVGFEGNVIWDTTRPNGALRRKMDNTKLFNMGWKPKIDFQTGIKLMIDWFKANKMN